MKKYLIFDLDGTLVKSMGKFIDVIVNILQNEGKIDKDLIKYIFKNTSGKSLKEQIKIIYPEKNEEEINNIAKKIYKDIQSLQVNFFPGTENLIKKLCKKYNLFITTGNSTKFAIDQLNKGNILNCFDVVLGSDKILKGEEHLKLFKKKSGDKDFFSKSIYIGDGNLDREFAKIFNIDFVHIGNDGYDKYEIPVVTDLPSILSKLDF